MHQTPVHPRATDPGPVVRSGPFAVATFSRCERYRFDLVHALEPPSGRRSPVLCFCMLNPSTADESGPDPSVRRCVGFARDRGYARLVVVNLFALRSTDPAALRRTRDAGTDPVGVGNWHTIIGHARRADRFVAAWGNHGELVVDGTPAAATLQQRLRDAGVTVFRLGAATAAGQPRHPLYVRADEPFRVHARPG